jgi:lipopolysaccharide transport system ATP-binding protein
MTRSEIVSKFDEIVDFSGIEKFIDTPVKHYSSGMALRLAFSVAAHLEPEILLVDEVLAVGDAEFQRKCLGKMGDVAQAGRTILLVSHNMAAITDLCERALLLDAGRVTAEGNPAEVVAQYLAAGGIADSSWRRPETADMPEDTEVVFESVRILSTEERQTSVVRATDPFSVELTYSARRPVRDAAVFIGIMKEGRDLVFTTMDTDSTEWGGRVREEGTYVSTCHIPGGLLAPGGYVINIGCHIPGIRFISGHRGVVAFSVSNAGHWLSQQRPGAITPRIDWRVAREPSGLLTKVSE